jgi:hypothetical protein
MVMISLWRDEVVKIAGYAQGGMLDILYGVVVKKNSLSLDLPKTEGIILCEFY